MKRTAAAVLALAPGAALAHAGERMVILTLPTGPFVAGAGLAVLLTALVGAVSGRLPRFGAAELARWRAPADVGSWLAAGLVWALVAAGFLGSRDPLANPLPLAVWTGVWVALVALCAAFGDLWRPLSPWRAPVRAARRAAGLAGGIGLSPWGLWPAVVGLLGFAWFGIVHPAPADPAVLAAAVAAYWMGVFLLALVEGEDWLDRGEFLTVAFALVGRVAPLWVAREGAARRLMAGLPGAQVVAMGALPAGGAAFVTLLIAAVSFDGLAETFAWLALVGVNPLEYPGRTAVMGANSAGLLAVWAAVAATILGAVRLGGMAAGPVLLSFLPIAAGYHLAHYLVALLTEGQYALAALNDPLGRGWALLGLPERWVGFGFLADRGAVWAVWGVQFALILGAHLLAVVLALRLAGGGVARHLPVTVVMVGYTVFGLWLLAAPVAG